MRACLQRRSRSTTRSSARRHDAQQNDATDFAVDARIASSIPAVAGVSEKNLL